MNSERERRRKGKQLLCNERGGTIQQNNVEI